MHSPCDGLSGPTPRTGRNRANCRRRDPRPGGLPERLGHRPRQAPREAPAPAASLRGRHLRAGRRVRRHRRPRRPRAPTRSPPPARSCSISALSRSMASATAVTAPWRWRTVPARLPAARGSGAAIARRPVGAPRCRAAVSRCRLGSRWRTRPSPGPAATAAPEPSSRQPPEVGRTSGVIPPATAHRTRPTPSLQRLQKVAHMTRKHEDSREVGCTCTPDTGPAVITS